ncbi:MAG: phosphorylase [Leptolyngbya sp. BL-A-14]
MIDFILVPQGAEYQAVCRGLGRATAPSVIPIPVSPVPLKRYLKTWQQSQSLTGKKLLIMGLCGGLVPHYTIGEGVLYRECVNRTEPSASLPCDTTLLAWLQQTLSEQTAVVRALTSDRLVSSAQEKQQLARQYRAEVVDMEGFAALEALGQADASIAMVRVVSDDAEYDLPTLSNAIDADGNLRSLPLAWGMIRQPIAAIRLIRGSLRGLKTLEAIAKQLVNKR